LRLLLSNTNYLSGVVGGGQRSVQVLAEGLAAQGHEVTVVSLGETGAEGSTNGVRTVRLPLRNLYWPFDGRERPALVKAAWHLGDVYNLRMRADMEAVIDEVRPDLLHTNVMTGFSSAIWSAATGRGVPVVHTLRDYHAVCVRSEMFRSGRPCVRQCLHCRAFSAVSRRLSDTVDAVVGNSRYILDAHLEAGAFGRVPIKAVIYNGYEPPADRAPAPHGDGRLRVGFLGRIAPHKGVEHLLEALRGLPAGSFALLVAGDGDGAYVERLRARYSGLPVEYLGFVKPTELFRRIDVLVVPSLWPEPLPRTIIEAYAHGVPVVGSDRGGIPEVIAEGVTGFVFSPDRPGHLRDVLASLLGDRERLAALRRGAAERSAEFLPGNVVARYLEVYAEALARRKGSGAAWTS